MEAIWKIEVKDFPAFIVVDDKGNDFFADVSKPTVIHPALSPREPDAETRRRPGPLGHPRAACQTA